MAIFCVRLAIFMQPCPVRYDLYTVFPEGKVPQVADIIIRFVNPALPIVLDLLLRWLLPGAVLRRWLLPGAAGCCLVPLAAARRHRLLLGDAGC